MPALTRCLAVGFASLLLGVGPACATGNFLCEADDASLNFTAESTFSHGLGEAFMGFGGAATVRLKDAPKDLAELTYVQADLVHHWFHGKFLKLHLYRERVGDAPHGYVELIIETAQTTDDETVFDGSYNLVVYLVGGDANGEDLTLKAEGKASCSVG